LGVFVLASAIFAAHKLGQKQAQLVPQLTPTPGITATPTTFSFLDSEGSSGGEKVFCQEPRPEVCTMECIENPPYICGSDGESYCSECQACSSNKIKWYQFQDLPCRADN